MTRMRADSFSETMIVRSRSKLLARAVAAIFLAALLAQLIHAAFALDRDGGSAPDFALKSITGQNLRLSEYRSDVVALAFWASWCGECRKQLPVLEQLQESMAMDGLQVLSVSFDDHADDVRDTAHAASLSFPVLMDPEGRVGRLYDVGDLPFVVLVDRDGRIRSVYAGRRAVADAKLEPEIRALLAE